MKLTGDQTTLLRAMQTIGKGTDSFGVIAAIQQQTGANWSLGKVYCVFDAAEREGLVTGWYVPGGPERGGKDRYLVELTDAGRLALQEQG